MINLITAIILLISSHTRVAALAPVNAKSTEVVLGSSQFSMGDRYRVPSVNEVMKKNILLNLAYMEGTVTNKTEISWDKVESPSDYSFTLKAGEVFAYHDSVLDTYKGHVVKTTNAHFNSAEGFVSDGYLVGDGVCHFASLINLAAQNAGLQVQVTKNHNFAKIEEVPKQYGVSIYVDPQSGAGSHNNLYITNNKNVSVTFRFIYDANNELTVKIVESPAISA